MNFLKSSVGRKLIMSATGFTLIGFVAIHLFGNTTIYGGPNGINAYAAALHRFPLMVWVFRLTLFTMFSLHVFFAVQLTLENRTAKPQAYAVGNEIRTTLAGRTMIWSGLLIGAFVMYHLLHFTIQVANPGIAAGSHPDAAGRPDVFMMVARSFQNLFISCIYVLAMAALGLHLTHGIQSAFQTMGLNNERTLPIIKTGGTLAALIISLGFMSFPLVIYFGFLR